MSTLTQIIAITLMNLRSVPRRLGPSLVIVIGIAGVVAVLVSMLAMATGFSHTVTSAARRDRAIVLRAGSASELTSFMSRGNVATIKDAPGIKKDSTGRSIASGEALVMVNATRKGESTPANFALRGVGPELYSLRPNLRIVEGRTFQPSLYEVIVGKAARAQFQNLDVGSKVPARGVEWTIVGVFESDGDAHESELLGDADTVITANRRGGFNAMTVALDGENAFTTFKNAVTSDPTLSVDVWREPDYYAEQSQQLNRVLSFVTYFVGSIMAIGAVFGALNAMYSTVSARTREIATLRALGYGGAAVVVSVLSEAVLLALTGGSIGGAVAWLAFNGNTVSTLCAGFSQIAFSLTVTAPVLGIGFAWAIVVGLIGGLLPALRAVRLPVATALRAR